MQTLFVIAILIGGWTDQCKLQQNPSQNEIFKLVFEDASNFELTTKFKHKQPKRILIIDTSESWRANRFWLPIVTTDIQKDEHHPYHHTYLFKDTLLDKLVSESERKALYHKAEILKSKKLNLSGRNFTMIKSVRDIKGFYFTTTEPVFTSDLKFAFVDLTVHLKEKQGEEVTDYFFGTICIVFEKQQNNQWEKIKVVNHLIL